MADRTCAVEDCAEKHYGRGWCVKHWSRWRKTGTADDPAPVSRRCSLDGCERKHKGHGLCAPHLRAKWLRDPSTQCSVAECSVAVIAGGLCGKHYQRLRDKGSLGDPVWYTPEERRLALRAANRRHYRRHRERVKAEKRERYWRNPAAENERAKRWRDANPGRTAELSRAWRQRNPEGQAEASRRWVRNNPEHARALWMANTVRRRGLARATGGGTVDYKAILNEHGMVCHLCHGEIDTLGNLHFDHVIPLSRGGPHAYGNVKPSHAKCNMRKGNKLMSELWWPEEVRP
jgi:5-methylcytosine-specific restriction endonuclease McrA